MTKPDDRHRCQTCGAKHNSPKGHRVLIALAWCVVLTVVQVFAALALDGWIAWAVWAIAARNTIIGVALIVGMSQLATEAEEEARR